MSRGSTDVYTSDGDKIGETNDVRGRFFKVDAAGQPDYWLETDCCAAGYPGGDVRLVFTKDELGVHKIGETRGKPRSRACHAS